MTLSSPRLPTTHSLPPRQLRTRRMPSECSHHQGSPRRRACTRRVGKELRPDRRGQVHLPGGPPVEQDRDQAGRGEDRKSTRLNSSHANISYAVFCLKKKKKHRI